MKNKKILFLGLAGLFLFSTESYSMNPALLESLNKQGNKQAVSSAAEENPIEGHANSFISSDAALVASLGANIIKELGDGSLQFDGEQCAILYDEIQKFMQTNNVPIDLKEEVELNIFRKILHKIAGRVYTFASESFKLFGDVSSLSPAERAAIASKKTQASAKKRAGASADAQKAGNVIAEIAQKAQERQQRATGSSEGSTSGESIPLSPARLNTTPSNKPTNGTESPSSTSFGQSHLKPVSDRRSTSNLDTKPSADITTSPSTNIENSSNRVAVGSGISTNKISEQRKAELNDF